MSNPEEMQLSLYKAGDKVYANLEGLAFLQDEHTELLYQYALENPFLITHVSPFDGENTIYTVETIADGEDGLWGWETEFTHSETALIPYGSDLSFVVGNDRIDPAQFALEYDCKREDKEVGHYEQKGRDIGALVDEKQLAYGNAVEQTYRVLRVFMSPYLQDGKYIIPESLLKHLLFMVRIIDKQNRIFNNPDGDLMNESPYKDINGYSLLADEIIN